MQVRSPQPPGKRGWRWKRTAAAAMLLLVGGAIMNVAVAWAAALWDENLEHVDESAAGLATRFNDEGFVTESWWIERMEGWGTTVFASGRYHYPPFPASEFDNVRHPQDVLPRWAHFDPPTTAFMSGEAEGDARIAVLNGWPLRSLGGTFRYDWVTGEIHMYRCIQLGDVFQTLSDLRCLPLRPVLSGFIINTLFYAAILWLLVAAPFTARRALRRRRGLCEKCAYPIGVSPVCTECGAAVPRKVEA